VYIPLGGNRKGKLRKYINLMITFGVSGLWHGANWTYVVWGLLNGGYQVIGDIIKPLRQKLISVLGLNQDSLAHKIVRVFITFVLIDISWVFFRAQSVHAAVYMLRSAVYFHPWNLLDGSLYSVALDSANFTLMLICIAILMFADIMKYKGVCIRQIIAKQDYWAQAVVIALSISAILLFGIWGDSYNAASFIYFQF
jgi:D-alanyl-lipoteichoic acid acyltransferase DltB (MBOAT superfamily)